jgi:hypothetical protein
MGATLASFLEKFMDYGRGIGKCGGGAGAGPKACDQTHTDSVALVFLSLLCCSSS